MKFLSVLIFVAFLGNCKSHSGNGNQTKNSQEKFNCVGMVNNKPSRCMEYSSNLDAQTLNYAKSVCGSGDLKGFTWKSGPCEEAGRLGECKDKSDIYRNFFYTPGYNIENATNTCQGWDGEFISASGS